MLINFLVKQRSYAENIFASTLTSKLFLAEQQLSCLPEANQVSKLNLSSTKGRCVASDNFFLFRHKDAEDTQD